MNQWTSSLVDPVVPLSTWSSLTDQFSAPGDDIVLSFDSTPDASRSSISIASKRADGRVHVELVANEDGVAWLVPRIKQLVRDHTPRIVCCDAKSPAANIINELGMQVRELGTADAGKHYAGFVTACTEGVLVHREDPQLTTALTGAVRRPLGDAFAWSRRNSSIDVSPIVSVSMALHIVQSEGGGQGVWSIREVIEEKRRAAIEQSQSTQPQSDTKVISMEDFHFPNGRKDMSAERWAAMHNFPDTRGRGWHTIDNDPYTPSCPTESGERYAAIPIIELPDVDLS